MNPITLLNDVCIYWINLDSSTQRFKHMKTLLDKNKLRNKRISAVNAEMLDLKNFKYKIHQGISKYEVACTLSHYKAIVQADADGVEYALICEDDITFDYLRHHHLPIIKLFESKPGCEILQLAICGRNDYNNIISRLPNNTIFRGRRDCTCCYLINKAGMRKICEYFSNMNNYIYKADNLIYEIANTYYTKPYVSYCFSNVFKTTVHMELNYESKREDASKKFWDEYYKSYRVLMLIFDTDDDENFDCGQKAIFREYWNMGSHDAVLKIFVKFSNSDIGTGTGTSTGDKCVYDPSTNTLYVNNDIENRIMWAYNYCFYNFHFDYVTRCELHSFWIWKNFIKFLEQRQIDCAYGRRVSSIDGGVRHMYFSKNAIIISNVLLHMLINSGIVLGKKDDMVVYKYFDDNNVFLRDIMKHGNTEHQVKNNQEEFIFDNKICFFTFDNFKGNLESVLETLSQKYSVV